jgi:hypothetical protein
VAVFSKDLLSGMQSAASINCYGGLNLDYCELSTIGHSCVWDKKKMIATSSSRASRLDATCLLPKTRRRSEDLLLAPNFNWQPEVL